MRILFLADGRSPIALNWIRHWVERGDEVYLASTFACAPDLPLQGLDIVPVAFSGMKPASASEYRSRSIHWSARTLHLRTVIRQWIGPLTLPRAARHLRGIVEQVRPDLVHAMRIPYEGMLAALAVRDLPLIISVWGNDFTLHALSSPLMAYHTRRAVRSAAALHVDCRRDARLAQQWGFPVDHPTLVVPGNGGVRTDTFYPSKKPVERPLVINPRGFRAYVRNDTFFRSIPLVLRKRPDASFLCASMAGEVEALAWVAKLGIEQSVELLMTVSHAEMAKIFREVQVVVSPSTHDGTPNSLLEGMACGCFPVAGDLESIREWITPGLNGLLVDPTDPQGLAAAVLAALETPDLRACAAKKNVRIIAERADYRRCMAQAEELYRRISKADR